MQLLAEASKLHMQWLTCQQKLNCYFTKELGYYSCATIYPSHANSKNAVHVKYSMGG